MGVDGATWIARLSPGSGTMGSSNMLGSDNVPNVPLVVDAILRGRAKQGGNGSLKQISNVSNVKKHTLNPDHPWNSQRGSSSSIVSNKYCRQLDLLKFKHLPTVNGTGRGLGPGSVGGSQVAGRQFSNYVMATKSNKIS